MRLIGKPFRIIRDNLRAYVVLNAVVYGACIVGMVIGMVFPDVTQSQVAALQEAESADLISSLVSTPAVFALAIFANNLFRVGVLSILLPSMVVPFAGIVVIVIQVFSIGVILAPIDADAAATLIPHSGTLLLEFQGYVVLALGAFILGRKWLRPTSFGAPNRRQGYLQGLKDIAALSILALFLLIIGAVYESISVAYVIA